MKKILILLATILVSVAVALTYFYFEAAVRHTLDYLWGDLFDTNSQRILVIPVCIIFSLIFFGTQHYLDPASEKQETEGLGDTPKPTAANFFKVLLIGFLSLIAGASLGPEAILVPACIIIGGYTGNKLFKGDKQLIGLLRMAGFVALFAAFFDSFIAGMLGLLMATKQVKIKISAGMIIIAALASTVTVLVLNMLESSAYTKLPAHSGKFSLGVVLAVILLIAGGCLITYVIDITRKQLQRFREPIAGSAWWIKALAAASGLSALYLMGGNLVQFTGNESVMPMLGRATSLGLVGLVWILIVKVAAISWSKTLSYRGGLVFPTIFAASVLAAIVQLYVKDLSFIVGLIATMAGVLVANAKVKTLF